MAKKVYDIKPPKLTKKPESQVKELKIEKTQRPRRKEIAIPETRYEKTKFFSWGKIAMGVGAVVVIIAIYLFFKLPKANIEIWPKVETLSFEQTITADKTAGSIDLSENIIPAEYFQEEKTESQEFEATGNASNEGKATGTITVYNKYDPPTSVTLKAGTHFLSDSGKYFITLQKVTIPAGKKSGSKITPGSVQVKVEAVEGGEGYNIGAATFSVPKLSGTNYYYSVYAESSKAMAGGYAGKIKKVTEDDISQAKDALTKKLIAENEASLRNNIPSDYVLLDDMISSEIVSASTEAKAGTIADNFTYQTKVKSQALAFKKSDLEKFAKDYIISQMQETKTILDNSFKIDYSSKASDIDKGKITLNLTFSSGVYQDIDKNSLMLSLTNKNKSQIEETIKDNLGDQISGMKVNFWPFWVTKSPKSQKAVKVELKFE